MSIASNYTIYATLSLVNVGVSYALLALLANNLSKNDFALYGVLTTIMGLVLIVANFGHKEAIYKVVAKRNFDELEKIVSSFSAWSLLFCGLATLTLFIDVTIGASALSFCALMYLTIVSAFNRGLSKYSLDALAQPLYRGLWLLISVGMLFAFSKLSTAHVFFSAFLAALTTFFLVGGYQHCIKTVKKIRTFSWPWENSTLVNFFMIEFATVVFLKVDILLLKYFSISPPLIADYFFSIQIFDAAVMLLTPIGYFFFNRVAKQIQKTKNTDSSCNNINKRHSTKIVKYVAGLLSIAALGQCLWYFLGQSLLATMFVEYVSSYDSILLLLLVLYPLVANIILSNYMVLLHKEKYYMVICFIGLAVCVSLNIVCIPLWQIKGAIYSRFVTEFIMLLLLFVYIRRIKQV